MTNERFINNKLSSIFNGLGHLYVVVARMINYLWGWFDLEQLPKGENNEQGQ
jgi:hypothetical protein